MIAGIGTDLTRIGRNQKSLENPGFLERVFGPQERALLRAAPRRAERAAANFAAKEAFGKALGSGLMREFSPCEAEALRDAGVKEIMLLGQNVNSYGRGLTGEPTFAQLLRALDGLDIPRIRFMTSHPKDLSDELSEVMGTSRPQFHLPVQSGNDEILRRMNRRYDRARYLERVRRLREAVPGIGLTTDIIVGFPGETEEQFQDTMALVDEVGYDSAFTFIYSPRTGTKAASMAEQVPEAVASDRIQRLIALQDRRQREAMARFVGMEEEVLVEGLSRRSDKAVSGKGRHGVSITCPGTADDVGQLLRVRVTEIKNNTLMAERTDGKDGEHHA